MPLPQIDTENADLNLVSLVTVLTDTPSTTDNLWCVGYIKLGDGTKNLDGAGGDFEFVITVAGQTVQPSPQVIEFGTEPRSSTFTVPFPVLVNEEVILRIKSPNGADTDVDVTAYLLEVPAGNTIQIKGDAQSATDLKDFADAGYDPVAHKVLLVAVTTENTDMRGTEGANTTPMRGTDGANTVAPLNASATRDALGLASNNLDTQIGNIPTTPMRGTDGANTEAMRGTDGANTVAPLNASATRDALGLASNNLDTQIGNIPTTPMRGTDGANTEAMRGTDGASIHDADAVWAAADRALSTPNDYKADISALATTASLDALITTVGVAGLGLGNLGGMSDAMKAEIVIEVTAALVAIHLDHLLAVNYDPASKPGVATALLNELIENNAGIARYTAAALAQAPSGGLDAAAVEAACAAALIAIHLDHLLGVDYDPTSKPGVATALFNELIENDDGIARYTENALEQAPSGISGDATAANQELILGQLGGVGETEINHDTGGIGNLKLIDGDGVGIGDALVRAFLSSEYNSDPSTLVVRGTTVTNDDGEWIGVLSLNTGIDYTIHYEKAGYTSVTKEVTVP